MQQFWRWLFSGLLSALYLLGCATAPEKIKGLSSDLWPRIVDHPGPSRTVHFQDVDNFDLMLSASLRSPIYPDVRVKSSSKFSILATPGRIDRWLLKVHSGGGEIYRCTTDPNESTAIALEIGKWIWDEGYSAWAVWETYRPAENFHAELWINAGDARTVEEVRFVPKSGYKESTQCERNIVAKS